MTLENSLANYSFLTLLASMIFYWIETSFAQLNLVLPKTNVAPRWPAIEALASPAKEAEVCDPTKKIDKFCASMTSADHRGAGHRSPSLAGAGLRSTSFEHEKYNSQNKDNVWFSTKLKNKYKKFGFLRLDNFSFAKSGILLSNFLLGLLLLLRWKESGHFPLSNLYESLMFLSWCFTGLHLYIDNYTSVSANLVPLLRLRSRQKYEPTVNKTKENNIFAFASPAKQADVNKILGSITIPSALLTNAFATFTLPKEMQEASPLVPALQSNWLMMHVTVMILSYAALILGSLMAIAFLVLTTNKTINVAPRWPMAIPNGNLPNPAIEASWSSTQKVKTKHFTCEARANTLQNNDLLLILDNLSYRILGLGFPLLTIGILSGAVWANEAWGSYWSWDPKETWALLTWLIFAIYLHTRISKGWEGKKPAIIASFGFLIVWMCYLGVNLIGEGLHSYGWIINT